MAEHIPHDLPEYEPNDPPQMTWERVKVFREGRQWTWEHRCSWRSTPANGYPYATHEGALRSALVHVRVCL